MFGCFVFHSRFGVFVVSAQWLLSLQDRRGQVFGGGFAREGNWCIFFRQHGSPCVCGRSGRTHYRWFELICNHFKFIASKTCFKFSVLFFLTLWRSYFGVKSVQAISDEGVSCFSVFTYNLNDVVVVFNLVYLDVVNVWVRSNYFVLDFNCWTVANVSAQSADKHRPLCRDFGRRDWCQVDFCQFLSAFEGNKWVNGRLHVWCNGETSIVYVSNSC